MAEIRIEGLRKAFGDFVAVANSNFMIEDGAFFVMLGPSGCGKTTTLRMIAGLELPTSGRILLDGEDVAFRRAAERDIAFVFQLFALYPHMNVRQNIGFPLKCQGVPRDEVRNRSLETARLLRIDHLLERRVSGLSGGDRQRVALGRAIVRRPKAFLMDEPLGALDAEFRRLMCAELRDLHDRIGATTVYVTHDQLEAMSMADRIAVMNGGLIEQVGTPQEIYDRPVSMFVADFMGSPPMNFLRFDGSVRPGDRVVQLGYSEIRVPELRGRVFGAEYLGTTQIVTIDTTYGQVKARIAASIRAQSGDLVGLRLRSEGLSVFDASTGRALANALRDGGAHG